MITEAPTLTNRVVTVEQCRQILIEQQWDRRTIQLLLDVQPKATKPFAAAGLWLVLK